MSVLRQLFVDDRDTSIVYFSPTPGTNAWIRSGSRNEFMNTTSHAADVGSGLNITFSGSLISIFGTISAANTDGKSEPTTQYFLDSSPPTTYHAKAIESNQYKVQFYRSPPLSVGPHTLGIVLQTVGHFWFDYMVISENFSVPSGDDFISQSALTATSYQPNQPRTTPTPEPSATPSSSTTQRSNSSTGTTVSEILGGILGLVLLLLLAWCIHHPCQKRSGKRWNKVGNRFLHAAPDSRRPPLCQSTSRQLVTPFTLSASRQNTDVQHRLDPSGANDGAVARITKNTSGFDLAPRLTTSTPRDPPPVYSNPQVEGSNGDGGEAW